MNESSAREMFEELGYEDCYEDAVMISYSKYYDGQNSASIKSKWKSLDG